MCRLDLGILRPWRILALRLTHHILTHVSHLEYLLDLGRRLLRHHSADPVGGVNLGCWRRPLDLRADDRSWAFRRLDRRRPGDLDLLF